MPLDPNPQPNLDPIGSFLTPPDQIPGVPKGWTGRGAVAWDVQKKSWIKGFQVQDKGEAGKGIVAQVRMSVSSLLSRERSLT